VARRNGGFSHTDSEFRVAGEMAQPNIVLAIVRNVAPPTERCCTVALDSGISGWEYVNVRSVPRGKGLDVIYHENTYWADRLL